MVFKRYIYKNGKKIGPYYYKNKKVDGKVISTYLGTTLPKGKELGKPTKSRTKDFLKGKYKYIIITGVILVLLVTLINFVLIVRLEPTGKISINLDEKTLQFADSIARLTKSSRTIVITALIGKGFTPFLKELKTSWNEFIESKDIENSKKTMLKNLLRGLKKIEKEIKKIDD